MKQMILAVCIAWCFCPGAAAQQTDSVTIRSFFTKALSHGKAYDDLRYLCKNIGHRISGSAQAQRAVEFTYERMKSYGFDTVYLQEVMVPQWVRGAKETAFVTAGGKKIMDLHITALGNSVGTGTAGASGKVVEVFSLKESSIGEEGSIAKISSIFHLPDPIKESNSITPLFYLLNQQKSRYYLNVLFS